MKNMLVFDYYNEHGLLVATFTEQHYSYAESYGQQHPNYKCIVRRF